MRWLWSRAGAAALWLPAPRVAALAALLAATGYAALAGFAIPTQRALVMLAAGLLGVLLDRRTAPSILLALALLAVLVFDPLAVLAPGFWLSFAAVAVILYVVTGDRRAPGWRSRLLTFGRVQWAVTLGLLPLLLFIFQQASVTSPLANLAAIPVVELVVIPATLLGVLGLLVLPDGWASGVLLVAATALEWLWPLLAALARWPAALWSQAAPAPWVLAAASVGVALLLAPRGFPGRWAGSVWLLPLLVVTPPAPAVGEVWLTLLDVGQGLSVVVRTAGHTLVFDTGARFNARFDLGRAVLVPYLRQSGAGRVDVLVVSHGDNDHIGGSGSLLAAVPVAEVLTSVPERIGGGARACADGQRWEWDGVRFEFLHPGPGAAGGDNNASCVLRIEGPYGRALLPGDIEAGAERALVASRPAALRAEVLVVPHHGSRTSSSDAFVDQVGPQLALIPVGHRNRYRHPHPDVVARYRERGIRLEDSAHAGAIEVRMTGAGVQVERQRDRHRRYWLGQ
jgi:competence protein ComEC